MHTNQKGKCCSQHGARTLDACEHGGRVRPTIGDHLEKRARLKQGDGQRDREQILALEQVAANVGQKLPHAADEANTNRLQRFKMQTLTRPMSSMCCRRKEEIKPALCFDEGLILHDETARGAHGFILGGFLLELFFEFLAGHFLMLFGLGLGLDR